MINLLPEIRKAFPFLNRRPVTEKDLFEFCVERDIVVRFTEEFEDGGVYIIYRGKHFIFLNKRLRGWMLCYVFAHEVAHYLFHFPGESNYGVDFFSVDTKNKNHGEAESVAALLLLPLRDLETVLKERQFTENAKLAELVARRVTIADQYKI
jgi:Zn-dependent peptidase ImmA (M78 family)